jgi:hypothetical protein
MIPLRNVAARPVSFSAARLLVAGGPLVYAMENPNTSAEPRQGVGVSQTDRRAGKSKARLGAFALLSESATSLTAKALVGLDFRFERFQRVF